MFDRSAINSMLIFHEYSYIEQYIDTTDAESSLWLVKIPEYIARRWANKDPNEMLGRMNVTLVPDKIGNGKAMHMEVLCIYFKKTFLKKKVVV